MMRRNRGEEKHTEEAAANTNALLLNVPSESGPRGTLQLTGESNRKDHTETGADSRGGCCHVPREGCLGGASAARNEGALQGRQAEAQPAATPPCIPFSSSLSLLNPFPQETGKLFQKGFEEYTISPQGDKPPWIQTIGGNKL